MDNFNLHPTPGDFTGKGEAPTELRGVAGAKDPADPVREIAANDLEITLDFFGCEPLLHRAGVWSGEEGTTITPQFIAQKYIVDSVIRTQFFHPGAGKMGQFLRKRSGPGTDVKQHLEPELIQQPAELVFRSMSRSQGVEFHFSTGDMENCRLRRLELVENLDRLWCGGEMVPDAVGQQDLNRFRRELHRSFLAGANHEGGGGAGEDPGDLFFADGVVVAGEVLIPVFNPTVGIDDDIGIKPCPVGFNPAKSGGDNLHR